MPGEDGSRTDVPVSKSRDELALALLRFGATGLAYAHGPGDGAVAVNFELGGLPISLRMTLPDRDRFARDAYGRPRTAAAVEQRWEQDCRRRWRTLATGIKAKLALVSDGISTVERECLGAILLGPDGGETVGERLAPALPEIARTGELCGG